MRDEVIVDGRKATTTGVGEWMGINKTTAGTFSMQATLDNESTTPAATIDIECSNDGIAGDSVATLTLSGNNDTSVVAIAECYRFVRYNVTAISDGGGTATVTISKGN